MITTASTPDVPLHLGGAPLRDVQPIAPLAPGQALSIALADATADGAGAIHHRSRA